MLYGLNNLTKKILPKGFGPSEICKSGSEIGGVSTYGAYISLTGNWAVGNFNGMYPEGF